MKKVLLTGLVWSAMLATADAQQSIKLWRNGECVFTQEIAQIDSITVTTSKDFKVADSYKCIEQMIESCMDIANEVGESKIGSPLEFELAGKDELARMAVESSLSFTSRDNYRNNIASIRNTYYGTTDGTIAEQSLSTLIACVNPRLDVQVRTAIREAGNAIDNLTQPFCLHIGDAQTAVARDKCTDLMEMLITLMEYIAQAPDINQDEKFDPIIKQFVQAVVLPSYAELLDKTTDLYNRVAEFQADPTDNGFITVAQAWLAAHAAFNKTEAYLFGPMNEYGLDPNMDSWPLDKLALNNMILSGKYNGLDWSEGDDDYTIELAQSVRGFHTLEYLVFHNGMPRTTHDTIDSTDTPDDIVYNESNAENWGKYMLKVASLLKEDASKLYNCWTRGQSNYNGQSYAQWFMSHHL